MNADAQPISPAEGESDPRAADASGSMWHDDNAALVAALRRGSAGAGAALFDKFGNDVSRLVWRLLGADSEHDDVVQQAFLRMLRSAKKIRDPDALRGWVVAVTVNTVRTEIKRRQSRSWLRLSKEDRLPEQSFEDDHRGRVLVRRTYAVLQKLPADERIAFTLRFVDGQRLEQVAAACDCSLATIKRRITKAEKRFVGLAIADPMLAERVSAGGRWGDA